MKIKKYYKWVILGLIVIGLSFLYTYKESFVEKRGDFVYSTTSYDNKKISKYNIDKIPGINSESCFNLCITNPDCKGYVIDNSYCHLKNTINKDEFKEDDKSKTIIVSKNEKKLEYKRDRKCTKEPIKEYNDTSYTGCYNYCIKNDDCAGFVTDFDKGDGPGKCKLYSSVIYNNDNIVKHEDKYTTILR